MTQAVSERGAFVRALARLAAAPLDTLAAWLALGVLLALPVSGYLLLKPLTTWLEEAGIRPKLTVFLSLATDRKTALAVEQRLQSLSDVAQTRFLPREDTLARLKAEGGASVAQAIAALPDNPFPDAIVVTPANTTPATLELLATTTRQWREVEHVEADIGWARRLGTIQQLLKSAALLLVGLLAAALSAIIFNTLRLQTTNARMGLLPSASRVNPNSGHDVAALLWQGLLMGAGCGLSAWLIVTAALLWLRLPVAELAALYETQVIVALPDLHESALLIGIPALLGTLVAAVTSLFTQHR